MKPERNTPVNTANRRNTGSHLKIPTNTPTAAALMMESDGARSLIRAKILIRNQRKTRTRGSQAFIEIEKKVRTIFAKPATTIEPPEGGSETKGFFSV
jgi:hypothetical protein